jgi:hypothetical protein
MMELTLFITDAGGILKLDGGSSFLEPFQAAFPLGEA